MFELTILPEQPPLWASKNFTLKNPLYYRPVGTNQARLSIIYDDFCYYNMEFINLNVFPKTPAPPSPFITDNFSGLLAPCAYMYILDSKLKFEHSSKAEFPSNKCQ